MRYFTLVLAMVFVTSAFTMSAGTYDCSPTQLWYCDSGRGGAAVTSGEAREHNWGVDPDPIPEVWFEDPGPFIEESFLSDSPKN